MTPEGPENPPVSVGGMIARAFRSLALTLCLAAALAAQQLPLVNYTTEDGLSYPQTWCVFQDSRGYVWVGTSEGISRFDGVSFLNFSAKDGLKNQTIRTIQEDREGRLWLGTDEGVARWDGRTFAHFGEEHGLGKGTIWACARDGSGRLWFGTQYGGVSRLDGDRFTTFGTGSGLASDYVYSLLVDSRGYLWLGHRGNGVTRCRIDEAGNLQECSPMGQGNPLAKAEVRAIVEDQNGNIYFGTRGNGVTRFDGTSFMHFGKELGLPGDDIYAMVVNHRNEIVIGGLTKGVAICSLPNLESCRSFNVQNGLTDNNVTGLLEDRDDALWMALDSGVTKLPTEKFLSFTSREGLPHHTVYSLFRDKDGTLWIGTVGGLARMPPIESSGEPLKIDAWRPNTVLPGNEVWDILRDSHGRLWIATESGLCEFADGRCRRVLTEKDGLGSSDLITVFEDRQKVLWIGTVEGVTRLELHGPSGISAKNYSTKDGLAGDFVYAIVEDEFGRLWMGTDQGLSVFDHGTFHSWNTSDGLPINEIFDLAIDESNTMWVGTNGGGLVSCPLPTTLSEPPHFRVWSTEKGFPQIPGVLTPNGDGRIWLGTSEGAVLLDPSARNGQGEILRRFDRASGLVGSEINALLRGSDGRLWIGTSGGLTLYDPRYEDEQIHPPLVTIEGLRVFGGLTWKSAYSATVESRDDKTKWLRETPISLAHDFGTLRIDFRGLSYRERSGIRYRYMLRGFDTDWSEPTAEAFKEYTNLDPGRYTFAVKALARGSGWSAPADLGFTVAPAWWQRTSFRVAFILALGLLLTFGYQARMYRVRVRNRELERVVSERTDDLRRYARALEEHSRALDRANARIREADRVKSEFLANMSHELRTPLNSIIGFSEVLLPRLEGRIESRESRFLANVRSSGRYLLLLINNLLDLSKIEAGRMELHLERVDIGELVESTCAVVQGYASERGIEIVSKLDPELPEATIDVAKVKQILLNLLSNAVKFSPPNGQVDVEVRNVASLDSPLGTPSYLLSVRDRGPGISEKDRDVIFQEFRQVGGGSAHPGGTGLGLALVRRFVTLMGGVVEVDSDLGEGSVFRVLLPVETRELGVDLGGWEEPADATLIRPRVLVVEGSRETFSMLASALEREGFLPVRAPDANEAMRMVREIQPSVVVLDLVLPDLRGWATLSRLDEADPESDLPLIFCVQDDKGLKLMVGADGVFFDPTGDGRLAAALTAGRDETTTDDAPVLVVAEPEAAVRITSRLQAAGLRAISSSSSQEGVSIATIETPRAVVVDLGMPDFRGFRFIQRLQQDRATSQTPVFIVAPRETSALRPHTVSFAETGEVRASFGEVAITLHELVRRRSARAVRAAAAGLPSA